MKMKLDIRKLLLLLLQIITTTTFVNIILLSHNVNSLPITSKPIESTAENLAWEAWLMVPVGQQQKSRKVTPKSIFIVPHKNNHTSPCPPGEHWAQNRCIPTVNIDTDKALLNQLSHLAPFSVDYDYDYGEAESLPPDGAEKLESSADTNPIFSLGGFGDDEPLKIDIFRETFPIGSSSGSGDSSGSNNSEDDNVFFVSERRRRPPVPPEVSLSDLDTDSSNYGMGANQEADRGDSRNPTESDSNLFLTGIDAILVPAISENQSEKGQNMSFSIFQDTLNSTSPQVYTSPEEIYHGLDEILERESLIPEKNGARLSLSEATSTEPSVLNISSSVIVETTTMKLEYEYDDAEGKTEFTRSITDLPLIPEETSQPTNFKKEDVTVTAVQKEDTTTITESNGDITSITSPKEDLTTLEITSPRDSETSTIVSSVANEEVEPTTIKEETVTSKEVITTTDFPKEDTTNISSDVSETTNVASDNSDTSKIDVDQSNDRFKYQQLSEEPEIPSAINIVEELKKINDLVAKNNRPSTTRTTSPPPNPSENKTEEEAEDKEISNLTNLLSKIILPSNTMRTSSDQPAPLSSTSTVWSSNSTSRNVLSKNSSGNSSKVSFTTQETPKSSTSDPSSSTSSKPEINEPDPYWWLPSGWASERTAAERPLLLRFWSAISGVNGSQTKV